MSTFRLNTQNNIQSNSGSKSDDLDIQADAGSNNAEKNDA